MSTASISMPQSPAQQIYPKKSILQLCVSGNKDEVAALLHSDAADLHLSRVKGFNALHLACIEEHADIIELLIHNKWDINAKTDNPTAETPLHIAVRLEKVDIVKLLVKHNASLDLACGIDGLTPLELAADIGNKEIVALLLQANTYCLTKNASGKTAIWYACSSGHRDIVELMINGLKDPLCKDEVETVNEALLQLLPSAESKVMTRSKNLVTEHKKLIFSLFNTLLASEKLSSIINQSGVVALTTAVILDDVFVVQQLRKLKLIKGLALVCGGISMIELATWSNSTKVIHHLFNSDKSLAVEKSQLLLKMPLWGIAAMLNAHTLEIFLPHINLREAISSDRDYQIKFAFSVLGYAIQAKKLRSVVLLLKDGASCLKVYEKPEHSLTALHLAANAGDVPMMQLLKGQLDKDEELKQNSASTCSCDWLSEVDYRGRTPLQKALIANKSSAVRFLVNWKGIDNLSQPEQKLMICYLIKNGSAQTLERLITQKKFCIDFVEGVKVALGNNNIECLKILIMYGNFERFEHGKSLLKAIIKYPELVELVMERHKEKNFIAPDVLTNFFVLNVEQKNIQNCICLIAFQVVNDYLKNNSIALLFKPIFSSWKLIYLFLEAGVDWQGTDKKGNTALHFAVLVSLEITATMLKEGVDPNVKNQDGLTALDVAKEVCIFDYTHTYQLEILLSSPSLADSLIPEPKTQSLPLPTPNDTFLKTKEPISDIGNLRATKPQTHPDTKAWFELLISRAAKDKIEEWLTNHEDVSEYINKYYWSTGQTSIHLAVFAGLSQCIPLMVEKGADLYQQTQLTRNTIMHLAALNNDKELARLYATDPKFYFLKNYENKLPLAIALLERLFECGSVLDILLENKPHTKEGEQISDKDMNSRKKIAELHRAIWCDYPCSRLKELLSQQEYGELINSIDWYTGFTAVQISVTRGRVEHLTLLKDAGAEILATSTFDGCNILHLIANGQFKTEEQALAVWRFVEESFPYNQLYPLFVAKDLGDLTPAQFAQKSNNLNLLAEFNELLNKPIMNLESIAVETMDENEAESSQQAISSHSSNEESQFLGKAYELLFAKQHDEQALLSLLDEQEAVTKINDIEGSSGNSLLHYAVAKNWSVKVINRLIELGADLIIRNDEGATPLHLAVNSSQLESVQVLNKHPNILSLEDSEGRTPYDIAVLMQYEDAFPLLKN